MSKSVNCFVKPVTFWLNLSSFSWKLWWFLQNCQCLVERCQGLMGIITVWWKWSSFRSCHRFLTMFQWEFSGGNSPCFKGSSFGAGLRPQLLHSLGCDPNLVSVATPLSCLQCNWHGYKNVYIYIHTYLKKKKQMLFPISSCSWSHRFRVMPTCQGLIVGGRH